MKHLLCSLVLLTGTVAFGQMGPGQPQPGQPPQSTPPTFPEGHKSPRQPMPPDQQAPAPTPEATSAEQIEEQITQQFSNEPTLASAGLRAEVDEASIVVSGTVDTAEQHDLALRIASSHAGDRNIVDKIKVKQKA
jgi:BON domain